MNTQVTREEFFKVIGPLNVTTTAEGNYPYRMSFKLRGVTEIGYHDKDGKYYLIK